MSTLFKKKFFLFIHLVIFLIVIEISMYKLIYDIWLPKYYLLELARILVFSGIVFVFKHNSLSIIYSILIFSISCLLYIFNITFDYASGDILTLGYIMVIGEAMKVASSSFLNLLYFLYLACFVISYFLTLIFYMKFIGYKKPNYETKYYPIGLAFAFFIVSIGILLKNGTYQKIEKDYKDDIYYHNMNGYEIVNDSAISLKKGSLARYGMFNHFLAEFNGIYLPEDSDKSKSLIDEYIKNGKESATNNYTGKLDGMNILEIMIESAPSYILSSSLTPNLYKISKEGLYFTNNLCKNKTNYSEILGMVGSAYNVSLSSGYDNPYSLPNILNNKGYQTLYFHDNDSSFYNRKQNISDIGFKKSYYHTDFYDTEVKFDGNMPYDTTFVKDTIDLMIPNTKFYTYWTTIGTHGPYNSNDESIKKYESYVGLDGVKYIDKLNKALEDNTWALPISNANPYVKRYSIYDFSRKEKEEELVKKQLIHFELEIMNFDEALGLLLNKLEKEGKLDNTLIILYGDHDAYYTSNGLKPLKYYVYGAEDKTGELEEYPNQYETFMAFYNPKLTNMYKNLNDNKNTVDIQTNPGIIVPTVLDLLGIKYNENRYLAKSIFNSNELSNLSYSYEIETIFSDKIMAYYPDYYKYEAAGINDEYKALFKSEMNNILYKNRYLHMMYKNHYFG